jgi:hypothetical protein
MWIHLVLLGKIDGSAWRCFPESLAEKYGFLNGPHPSIEKPGGSLRTSMMWLWTSEQCSPSVIPWWDQRESRMGFDHSRKKVCRTSRCSSIMNHFASKIQEVSLFIRYSGRHPIIFFTQDPYIQCHPIWASWNNSLPWNFSHFGIIPLTNHYSQAQGEQGSVVIKFTLW